MWSFKGIDEPTLVKAEHLPVARALGILSLLPLAKPQDPKKLLRRLMLENWTPGLLISANAGREHAIPQVHWQSEPAESVFQQLRVSIRFDATAATLWRPIEVSGHVVIQAALLSRAALDGGLIAWPDVPETWIRHKDNLYQAVVAPAMQKARAATYDEAVKRWEAQGEAAAHVPKPVIVVPTRLEAEIARAARIAGQPELAPTRIVGGGGHLAAVRALKRAEGDASLAALAAPVRQNVTTGREKANLADLIDGFLAARLADPKAELLTEPDLREAAGKHLKRSISRRTFHDRLAVDRFAPPRRQKGQTDARIAAARRSSAIE